MMLTVFYAFIKYRIGIIRAILVLVIVGLLATIIHLSNKPARVIQLDPITKVIEVPVEKLTTKIVKQYVRVEDKPAVEKLMKDNAAIGSTVQQLTVSLADTISYGAGTITILPPTDTTPTIIEVPKALQFKDWRLDFQSDGTTANYTLTQKFSIINTVGRDTNNTPVNIVRLFEIGENGERVAIPTVETTTISTQPTRSHFYVKPTIQGGMGILPRWETTTTPNTTRGRTHYDTGFVIATPWWKRGTTTAVENTRYAFLTPMATFNDTEFTSGLSPVSVNLGTLRHSPVTDIWFSPYVGLSSKQGTKKFAVVFTTTF